MKQRPASTPFKSAFPLIVTSFVNRVGTIGLSLIPALLIQLQISTDQSSLIMALTKSALLVGTFFGGWMYDRLGTRVGIFCSFLLAGLGLGFLPFQKSVLFIAAFALVAQLGQAMFPSLARIMLSELAAPEDQQEAVGWLRGSNNMGQIFSFGIGWLLMSSIWGLMLLDSLTSLLAIVAGLLLIPKHLTHQQHPKATSEKDFGNEVTSWAPLIAALAMAVSFNFFYELFMVGSAIKFQTAFGSLGVSYFARAMVLNTILCTFLSVIAARHLNNPLFALPCGLLMAAISCGWGLAGDANGFRLISATLLFTLGEIVFSAMSNFLLYRLIPPVNNRGAFFGGVLVLQNFGRILGAALAFPLTSHGHVYHWFLLLFLLPLAFAKFLRPKYARA